MEIFKLFGSIFVDNDAANKSIAKTEEKAGGLTKKFGTGIKMAAAWGAGLASAAGIGLGALVKAGDNLKNALNGLQASTGASTDEMKGMKDSLENIYKGNYGKSFDDIAGSMAFVKQNTGLAGQALEDATKNAIILRDTFEFDVSESTRTAQSLMKQFGITSKEAFNLIAQGAQNGANKNGDLLDSLNEYAPQFKSMGFSAEEFTNVLIDGAKNGAFSIDKVGDAVKEFNIRAKDGSKTTEDAFKSLGMNAVKMGEKFAQGGETGRQAFQQVMTNLNNIKDPMEKNRIGVELFGTQFEDLEAKGISALAEIGTNANLTKDALGEIDKVKYDSFGQALLGIGRNIQMGLFIPFEEKVMPKINEFAQWIKDHMPEIQATISGAIGAVSDIFDKFSQAIKFVKDNMDWLLPVITGITAAVVAQMVIDKLITLYKAWQTVTKTQTTLQWLLNAALNANPLGLVAIAIGTVIAAGVLLYKNWDTVKEKLGVFWNYIKNVFGKIRDFIGSAWDGAARGIKSAVNSIIRAFNGLIRGLNGIKVNVPDWVPGMGGKGFGFNIAQIPMLAKGTDYFNGGLALVGEKGPELVNLPRGSKVKTADETQRELAAGTLKIEVPIYLDGYEIARASAPHLDGIQGTNMMSKMRMNGVK